MDRDHLRDLLAGGRLDDLAGPPRPRRVLARLVPLTYDADPLVAWRAVEAMGVVAERLSESDPDAVREHLRKLFWLITEESGGICWRAPEAMAEIVRRRPDRYGDYVPIVVHLILEMAEEDLAHFRPGLLWAIGRFGLLGAEYLDDVLPAMVAALEHPDPQVRGMAVWALGEVGCGDILAGREALLADEGLVELYEDGVLVTTTPGALAARVPPVRPTS